MSAHILYELTSLQSISWLLIPPLFCRFDLSDFKRLEPYAGKLARTVLRGGVASNSYSLPDIKPFVQLIKTPLMRGFLLEVIDDLKFLEINFEASYKIYLTSYI